jgi:hypothetical protein
MWKHTVCGIRIRGKKEVNDIEGKYRINRKNKPTD